MKAVARLHVLPDMAVTMTITMSVEEMRACLKVMDPITTWPAGRLAHVIRKSLERAEASFVAEEHDVSPS